MIRNGGHVGTQAVVWVVLPCLRAAGGSHLPLLGVLLPA